MTLVIDTRRRFVVVGQEPDGTWRADPKVYDDEARAVEVAWNATRNTLRQHVAGSVITPTAIVRIEPKS
jgi:hypothetical protein